MEFSKHQIKIWEAEKAASLDNPSLEYVRGLTRRLNEARQRLINARKAFDAGSMREIAEEITVLKTLFNKAVGDDIEKFYQSEATA